MKARLIDKNFYILHSDINGVVSADKMYSRKTNIVAFMNTLKENKDTDIRGWSEFKDDRTGAPYKARSHMYENGAYVKLIYPLNQTQQADNIYSVYVTTPDFTIHYELTMELEHVIEALIGGIIVSALAAIISLSAESTILIESAAIAELLGIDISFEVSSAAIPGIGAVLAFLGILVAGVLLALQQFTKYNLYIVNNTHDDIRVLKPILMYNPKVEIKQEEFVIPAIRPAGSPIPGVPNSTSDDSQVCVYNLMNCTDNHYQGTGFAIGFDKPGASSSVFLNFFVSWRNKVNYNAFTRNADELDDEILFWNLYNVVKECRTYEDWSIYNDLYQDNDSFTLVVTVNDR
ncbi:hypothetical protein [Massilia sp. Root335]|jgi:hypothetical protein|uniref:hypothetical protein n=1 Tax=Massilia sp. Root335 TaxID=1736517 RepID=UPI0006F8617E|nr:hypothetical protein [Massilia sp. Root335]KQV47130.1 hypothetical protein ASC93_14175 [Massilia sp. Root335]